MDRLESGNKLLPGQSLKSVNSYHVLAMQEDGNLVLYSLAKPVWASNTNGHPIRDLIMQTDGNLVMYAPDGKPYWATNTDGRGPSCLVMQDDRNAVVYDSAGKPTWATNTNTNLELWERVQFEASPQLMAAVNADPVVGPSVSVGIACTTSPQGILTCTGALIAIAVIMEFAEGKPPFGPNNDIRVIGRNINREVINAGKEISKGWKNLGGSISKTWKRWF